jgi:hypothetical protein
MAAPRGAMRHIAPTNPLPERSRQRRVPPTRQSGLPGRSGAASRRSTTRPRSAADAPPPACTRPPQRCPHPCSSGPVDRAARDGAGPHGTRLDPVKTAAPSYRGLPIATARVTQDETAVTGRTGGHQTAGRRTGWTPAGRTAASRRGSQMAGHWMGWTPDGWTPGRRAGLGGHRAVDTAWRWTADSHLGIPTTATRTYRWDVQKLRRADVAWVDPQSGQLSSGRSCRELVTAAPDRCRRPSAVRSAPRRTAVLRRLRVESRARRWRPSVMGS